MKYFVLGYFLFGFLWGQVVETRVVRAGSSKYEATTLFTGTIPSSETPEISLTRVRGKVYISGTEQSLFTIQERILIVAKSSREAEKLAQHYRFIEERRDKNQFSYQGHSSSPPSLRFIYELTVPLNTQLSVETSGGNIRVQNTQGVLALKTSGGDIDLNQVIGVITGQTSGGNLEAQDYEGVLKLRTSGGNIRIRKGSGPVDVSTSGGDIHINQVTGNIRMETSGGSLWAEDIAAQNVVGETSGGNIRLETVRGTVSVSTSGGHIELHDIMGSVTASTSGGNIQAFGVRGPLAVSAVGGSITGKQLEAGVRATTIGGNIHIEKEWNSQWGNQDILLENNNGNIYLKIPENFPTTIEAIIKGQRIPNSIISDIPLTLDYSTQTLVGNGSLNGGTYQINLKTTYGQIVIVEAK